VELSNNAESVTFYKVNHGIMLFCCSIKVLARASRERAEMSCVEELSSGSRKGRADDEVYLNKTFLTDAIRHSLAELQQVGRNFRPIPFMLRRPEGIMGWDGISISYESVIQGVRNLTEQISRRFPGHSRSDFKKNPGHVCIASACYVMYGINYIQWSM